MNLIEQIKLMQTAVYENEEGDKYSIELLDPMDEEEIDELREQLPGNKISAEIEELLKFTKGFLFDSFDEIRFDTFHYFGFEELFPNSIQLAGDGAGNFWILEIDSKGNWGSVYYVCHDPAVIVKHSQNLQQFLEHVHEFGLDARNSHLNEIHEEIVFQIWENKIGFSEKSIQDLGYNNSDFDLSDEYLIAELEDKNIKSGFSWGIYGSKSKIIRPDDKAIWIIGKVQKKSLFSRLFKK